MRAFYDPAYQPRLTEQPEPALFVQRDGPASGRWLLLRPWPEVTVVAAPSEGARELDLAGTTTRDVVPEPAVDQVALAEAERGVYLTELRAALERALGDGPRYTRAAVRRALDDVLGAGDV